MGSIPASRTRQIKTPRFIQPALPCGCRLYPHYYFSKPDKVCIAACQLAGEAMCVAHPKTSLTPLPLSVYNLPSPPAADIKIDIETVEKLIGEIIVQPLR
ncbi:hypothetical protein [Janthinobacterium tructae]|uniref:hypothetical protein n=1 Tax=Janthinobacterium tructae TaxID=2590869 RepID=UPI00249C895D|nr:hypothetical protein [Janthinobacterium tructae]MDI3296090.1 hypothetical protein [Janthinobacterium tructae]